MAKAKTKTVKVTLKKSTIGAKPKTYWVPSAARNPNGFISTSQGYQTVIPGLFAAGDVRVGGHGPCLKRSQDFTLPLRFCPQLSHRGKQTALAATDVCMVWGETHG